MAAEIVANDVMPESFYEARVFDGCESQTLKSEELVHIRTCASSSELKQKRQARGEY